jgi:hypothetical protein
VEVETVCVAAEVSIIRSVRISYYSRYLSGWTLRFTLKREHFLGALIGYLLKRFRSPVVIGYVSRRGIAVCISRVPGKYRGILD